MSKPVGRPNQALPCQSATSVPTTGRKDEAAFATTSAASYHHDQPNIGPLPTLTTINQAHLARLIEIETRNLTEARSDHERLKAQTRLERLVQIEGQLALSRLNHVPGVGQRQTTYSSYTLPQAQAYSQAYSGTTGGI